MNDNLRAFPATQRRFSQEQLDHARKEGAIEMHRRVVAILESARVDVLEGTVRKTGDDGR